MIAIDEHAGPKCKALMDLGFSLGFIVEPLPMSIVQEGETFVSKAVLTVTPERGKARRVDQAKGEALSNLPVEMFSVEMQRGAHHLRDLYAERCADAALTMIEGAL